ncbi:hypothetical protein GCM10011309_12220 [Litorimonas cladophorae]|uniref:Lysozyme n=1 Tax=Litorimonas cladophorae TaxID=1220491 RepID=A0A918KHR0_9PROT|nr:lysozyme [Litorimonas cladophorae]GGX63756.1 hypothetical protein GCM10011309_12220 [Litorimonas cladophorae]
MSQKLTDSALAISDTGLKLIKAFEGYRPVDRELVTGQRVVGYGHRLYSDTAVMMSKSEAERVLRADLQPFEDMINSEVHAPLTQSQFDALCSFAFNIGPKAFLTSDTLRALNNGRPLDAANGLDIWRKSEIAGKTYVVDALMRRRTAEKALFLRTERNLPAGSIDLPPVRDTTISGLSTEDALPVFSASDSNGVVATAPHEAIEPQHRRREDGPAGALQLSELDVIEDDTNLADIDDKATDDTPTPDPHLSIDVNTDGDETELSLESSDNVILAFPDQTATIDLSSDLLADISSSELDMSADDLSSMDPDLDAKIENELPETADFETDLAAFDTSDSESSDAEDPSSDEIVSDTPVRQSPIAAAASDIVARLDALIENADAQFDDRDESWPESLITTELSEDSDPELPMDRDEDDQAMSVEPEQPATRRARKRATAVTPKAGPAPAKPMIVIDELAQDDAFRVRNDSAAKYIQSRPPLRQAQPVPTESSLGLWIPVLLGFLLVGLAGGTMISGAEALLGDWGPIIAFTGFVIGLALILAGVYAALRMNLRD